MICILGYITKVFQSWVYKGFSVLSVCISDEKTGNTFLFTLYDTSIFLSFFTFSIFFAHLMSLLLCCSYFTFVSVSLTTFLVWALWYWMDKVSYVKKLRWLSEVCCSSFTFSCWLHIDIFYSCLTCSIYPYMFYTNFPIYLPMG